MRGSAVQARAHKERGNELFKVGEYSEAIQCYREAIELEPWDEAFWLNLSACYTKMEKWEQAVESAEKAIDLRWRLVKGHYRKAYALLQMGKDAPLPEAGPSLLDKAWTTCKVGLPRRRVLLELIGCAEWNQM